MDSAESKIVLIKEDVAGLSQEASGLTVKNKEDQEKAINFLGSVKTRLKRVEQLRKEFVAPLNAQVKKINLMFKAQSEPLAELEVQIKGVLKVYMDEQDRLAREEAERKYQEKLKKEKEEREKIEEAKKKEEELRKKGKAIEAEAERKKQEEAEKALEEVELEVVEAPTKTVRAEGGAVTRKLTWKWKVIDEKLLRKKHPELFILDEKQVNQLVKGGERDIEGVEAYQESELSMKA